MNDAMWKLVYNEESLYPNKLEQHYPRIMEKIIKLWPTPQMEEFFNDLMVNNDPMRGDRQGFPPEVARELYYLSKVFEGTRNLPKSVDNNPLAHLNSNPVNGGNFKYSPQNFVNMRTPSDDSPWISIDTNTRREIESMGYPSTAPGFLKAAGARDLSAIGLFLNCKINIDTCDERGWTPLIIAAFNGSEELAKLIIQNSANVSIKDKGGYTPMHWAAFKGHANIVKQLIIKDADINARSLRGWTPLLMAAMNGHLPACATLIASGANTNLSSDDGWTALQKASHNNHTSVIKLFLSLMKVDLRGLKSKE